MIGLSLWLINEPANGKHDHVKLPGWYDPISRVIRSRILIVEAFKKQSIIVYFIIHS